MKLHFLFAYPVLNKTSGTAKGYLISRPNNWVEFTSESVPGSAYTGVFKDVPQNGTIVLPLSNANTGLNLVGSAFFNGNPDMHKTIYFWRKRNGTAISGYITYNANRNG